MANLETNASAIRRSLLDNINSGLKMLGKNDRQLFISHQSYYNQLPSGISNKVADLVSKPVKKRYGNRNNNRQEVIVIGEENSSMENPLMSKMFDGILFFAQMIKYGASKFMDMMTKTWDWYKTADNNFEMKVHQATAVSTPGKIYSTLYKV